MAKTIQLTKEQKQLKKEVSGLCQQLEDKFRQARDMGILILLEHVSSYQKNRIDNSVLDSKFNEFTFTFEYMEHYKLFQEKQKESLPSKTKKN